MTRTGFWLKQKVWVSLIMTVSISQAANHLDSLQLEPCPFKDLPFWNEGVLQYGFKALTKACQNAGEKLPPWDAGIKKAICQDVLQTNAQDRKSIEETLKKHFNPFLVRSEGKDTGLFTGYYQPIAKASLQKKKGFETPLYKRPSDLLLIENLGEFREELAGQRFAAQLVEGKLRPYLTRQEIEEGGLKDKGLEIAWLKDPVDAFFIAVQGSGVLELEDGKRISISYDGANGHTYTAIGRVLVDKGELSRQDVSMQSIRQWFKDNPTRIYEITHHNKSYIFFKVIDQDQPEGSHQVGLTPQGSLAVDSRYIPLGSLLWLSTETPRLNCLVVAQDTGSAIKGPIRGDFYWGTGEEAGNAAGTMASKGRYYLLLPKKVIDEKGS